MTGPAGYRSCLARAQARGATAAEDVRDDWTRQALINEANRLYGRRSGDGR